MANLTTTKPITIDDVIEREAREEAAREWEAAKARFEAKVLGEEPAG